MTIEIIRPVNDYDESGQTWLQAPGETDAHYYWFQQFLAAGATRSINAVYRDYIKGTNAEKVKTKKEIVASTVFREMTRENKWVERARAFDEWSYRNARMRHVIRMNEATDLLFEGAVDAAKHLVDVVKGGRTTPERIKAASSVLNRCGIIERAASYLAPVPINSNKDAADKATEIVMRIEGASKSDLELIAADDSD